MLATGRLIHLLREPGETSSFRRQTDLRGGAHRRRPGGHVAHHHRVGADPGPVADGYGPEDLGAGPDEHVVTHDGAAVALVVPADGHSLVDLEAGADALGR